MRNQWGDRINVDNALVSMSAGKQTGLRATISASTQPGLNYLLRVPMDSGLTSDLYQSTAFLQGMSFQMIIRITNIQYIPNVQSSVETFWRHSCLPRLTSRARQEK